MNKPYVHKTMVKNYTPVSFRTHCGYGTGTVGTVHGIVRVYSQPNYYCLNIILDGVQYSTQRRKGYSRRYLVTLAKRFAKDMFEYLQEKKGNQNE